MPGGPPAAPSRAVISSGTCEPRAPKARPPHEQHSVRAKARPARRHWLRRRARGKETRPAPRATGPESLAAARTAFGPHEGQPRKVPPATTARPRQREQRPRASHTKYRAAARPISGRAPASCLRAPRRQQPWPPRPRDLTYRKDAGCTGTVRTAHRRARAPAPAATASPRAWPARR